MREHSVQPEIQSAQLIEMRKHMGKLVEELEAANGHLSSLNNSLIRASESSGVLARALNWLTAAGVAVAILAVGVEVWLHFAPARRSDLPGFRAQCLRRYRQRQNQNKTVQAAQP